MKINFKEKNTIVRKKMFLKKKKKKKKKKQEIDFFNIKLFSLSF